MDAQNLSIFRPREEKTPSRPLVQARLPWQGMSCEP